MEATKLMRLFYVLLRSPVELHFRRKKNDLTIINTFSYESIFRSHIKIMSAFSKMSVVVYKKIEAIVSLGENNKLKHLIETIRI